MVIFIWEYLWNRDNNSGEIDMRNRDLYNRCLDHRDSMVVKRRHKPYKQRKVSGDSTSEGVELTSPEGSDT